MGIHITKDILRFDVSMADTFGVNIGDGSHKLIGVDFDYQIWHFLLHFVELFHHSIGCIRNVVHHNIQVNLIWLVSVGVEALAHLHAVGVMQHLEDCQLSVFVSLVLKNFFYRNSLSCFGDSGLEHYTEGSVSDDFLCVVGHALLEFDKNKKKHLLAASFLHGFVDRRRPIEKQSKY
jgi:hypothetical protein